MSRLFAEHLEISYGEHIVVENLNISIPDGKITALVGPNGSGKSTIFKAMARLLKTQAGNVYLDGKAVAQMQTKQVAKKLAILPQHPIAPEGLTVYDLISFGRFPHQKGLGTLSHEDKDIIHNVLKITGMEEFAERQVDHMSGGQRQRAWIALALAQGTDILFLDEPTTFLDMAHQLEVLTLLQKLNEQEGKTIVMVVHDLNHASIYAHHVIAIKEGSIVQQGKPVNVITSEMLYSVFGIHADVIQCPRTGAPLCLPYALTGETYIKKERKLV